MHGMVQAIHTIFHAAVGKCVEELHGGRPGFDGTRYPPRALHLLAIRALARVAMRRERGREPAHLAPAHGIGRP